MGNLTTACITPTHIENAYLFICSTWDKSKKPVSKISDSLCIKLVIGSSQATITKITHFLSLLFGKGLPSSEFPPLLKAQEYSVVQIVKNHGVLHLGLSLSLSSSKTFSF